MFDRISRFSFPTQITFGPGARKLLPEHLSALGIKKPLIVTDQGLKNTDVLTAIETVLEKSGVPFAA